MCNKNMATSSVLIITKGDAEAVTARSPKCSHDKGFKVNEFPMKDANERSRARVFTLNGHVHCFTLHN